MNDIDYGSIEYRNLNNEWRRIQIVPDTSEEEAWLIESHRQNGEWRIAGRKPISDCSIVLDHKLVDE